MKISGHVQAIINAAYNEARGRNHEYLTPEHILYAALAFDEVQDILTACGANPMQLKHGMEAYFEQKMPVITGMEPTQTVGFKSVIERAVAQVQSSQKETLDVADILVSLFDEERNYCAWYLRKAGVKRFELLNILSHGYDNDGFPGPIKPGGSREPPLKEGAGEEEGEGSVADFSQKTRSGKRSALERYATELTALARENRLEPVIGR
jgi:ATP-dependent Clp protease ATP-binding subunit ClpA